MSPTLIAGYLALFSLVGFLFIFINLWVGSLVRPKEPNTEKLEVYECGEPTIGSSFVQFDLRFYVVALLFIIFDVEVALFFPWAVVYGKSNQLADARFQPVVVKAEAGAKPELAPAAAKIMRDLGVPDPQLPLADKSAAENTTAIRASAKQLSLLSIFDILAFFAVLMVGFAYVWFRGDLDWVRAVSRDRGKKSDRPPLDFTDSDLEPTLAA
ncbi:MAG: NADH-quinone oxidoreductase subunit A [Planctomycetaceae bacterium]|nr:NADH-quinone oxidoreductase subunit A [Planctomycetaceae bacterium]